MQTHLGHETGELKQIHSRSALIVMGRKNTFKHTCQPVSPLVLHLFDIARSERLVTAVDSIILDVALFYVFPTVLRPLTYREAGHCLLPLVEDVKKALEELHDLGFAHIDVRLNNICLKETSSGMMAVLIDFDFVMDSDQPLEKPHLVRKSTMYNIPEYQHFSVSQHGSLIGGNLV